jgi:hypothetical protein
MANPYRHPNLSFPLFLPLYILRHSIYLFLKFSIFPYRGVPPSVSSSIPSSIPSFISYFIPSLSFPLSSLYPSLFPFLYLSLESFLYPYCKFPPSIPSSIPSSIPASIPLSFSLSLPLSLLQPSLFPFLILPLPFPRNPPPSVFIVESLPPSIPSTIHFLSLLYLPRWKNSRDTVTLRSESGDQMGLIEEEKTPVTINPGAAPFSGDCLLWRDCYPSLILTKSCMVRKSKQLTGFNIFHYPFNSQQM